jgi:predicted molibdopterin-dependent oxidoreductase YjgC
VPDWSIFVHLAQRWPGTASLPDEQVDRKGRKAKRRSGSEPKPWTYGSPQAVLEEIAKAVPAYAGITWAGLGTEGRQWPLDAQSAGSRRLSVPSRPAVVSAPSGSDGQRFPYALVTGRVLYDGGTLFKPSEDAQGIAVPVAVGVNPQDAAREKLEGGAPATVASASGVLTLPVAIDERVQAGTLWIPYSLPGAPVETLLDMAGDGVGTRVRIARAG